MITPSLTFEDLLRLDRQDLYERMDMLREEADATGNPEDVDAALEDVYEAIQIRAR